MPGSLGMLGTLSVGGEITEVRDVKLNVKGDEADDTTRNNNGWKSSVTGLLAWKATFTLVKKDSDLATYNRLETACFNKTLVAVTITDAFGNSFSGNAAILDFSRNEPLNDVVTVDVELAGNGEPSAS